MPSDAKKGFTPGSVNVSGQWSLGEPNHPHTDNNDVVLGFYLDFLVEMRQKVPKRQATVPTAAGEASPVTRGNKGPRGTDRSLFKEKRQ